MGSSCEIIPVLGVPVLARLVQLKLLLKSVSQRFDAIL